MSDVVDLIVEDDRWDALDLEALAAAAAELALSAAGIATRDVEIAVLACDDARIRTLNSDFRGKDKATNVLSWPALDLFPDTPGAPPLTDIPAEPGGPVSLGDIAIAWETVAAEAADGGVPLADHVLHLLLHGCLHLLGYDHQTDADAERMESLEIAALASRGVPSPY